jgi:ABC-type transporter Mla subunit MlaD
MTEQASATLEALLAKQSEAQQQLEGINQEITGLKAELASEAARDLFKALDKLSALFVRGAVARVYGDVQRRLEVLAQNDPEYKQRLTQTANVYDIPTRPTPQGKYYATTLLGGPLTAGMDLWTVLGQIHRTRSVAGNPFVGEEVKT